MEQAQVGLVRVEERAAQYVDVRHKRLGAAAVQEEGRWRRQLGEESSKEARRRRGPALDMGCDVGEESERRRKKGAQLRVAGRLRDGDNDGE